MSKKDKERSEQDTATQLYLEDVRFDPADEAKGHQCLKGNERIIHRNPYILMCLYILCIYM